MAGRGGGARHTIILLQTGNKATRSWSDFESVRLLPFGPVLIAFSPVRATRISSLPVLSFSSVSFRRCFLPRSSISFGQVGQAMDGVCQIFEKRLKARTIDFRSVVILRSC